MTISEHSTQFITGTHLEAWQRLLRTNCMFLRELDVALQDAHQMTISDYDVLVSLRSAPEGRLRMSDLARHTMLTRSGITRLVQGLERDGFIERVVCTSDARVTWVRLSAGGMKRLEKARATHHAGIRRLFAEHLTNDDARQLSDLLGLLPGVADGSDTACCGGEG